MAWVLSLPYEVHPQPGETTAVAGVRCPQGAPVESEANAGLDHAGGAGLPHPAHHSNGTGVPRLLPRVRWRHDGCPAANGPWPRQSEPRPEGACGAAPGSPARGPLRHHGRHTNLPAQRGLAPKQGQDLDGPPWQTQGEGDLAFDRLAAGQLAQANGRRGHLQQLIGADVTQGPFQGHLHGSLQGVQLFRAG